MHNIIEQFKQAMLQHGLQTESEILVNNTFQRFHINGDKPSTRNGWYILNTSDDFGYGVFGCWKRDIKQSWCSKQRDTMTCKEVREYRTTIQLQQQRIADAQKFRQIEASKACKIIWTKSSSPPSDFPYLKKKQINETLDLRFINDKLLVPVYDADGVLTSLQSIQVDGSKRFYPGGRIQGCYSQIGDLTDILYICEGYATAWSIYKASQCQVFIAFHAGNLLPVAKTLQQKYPDKTIVIAADNDTGNKSNVGLDKAKAAAKQLQLSYVYPKFDKTETGSDFNDLMCLHSLNAVKQALQQLHYETPLQLSERIKSIDLFDGDKKKSASTLLIEIGSRFELFHDENEEGYACIQDGTQRYVYAIRSQALSTKLGHCYLMLTDKGANNNALQDALDTLNAKAIYQNPQHIVYRRVASVNGRIYIDLGYKDGRAIEITKDGWQVTTNTSVYFVQSRYAQPLPIPSRNSDINLLWKYINVAPEDRVLVWGYILGCFNPNPPYPILWLYGAQGSGKSSATKILKRIIDPNTGETTCTPKDEKDLIAYAKNNHLICFDNNSYIDNELSDHLCRIASGAAISVRQLYTNSDEMVYKIARPAILNGISNNINRGDLLERTISVELQVLSGDNRKTESEIYAEFTCDAPKILGAICDDVSRALANKDQVDCKQLPRMADFSKWVMAAESGSSVFSPGQFIAAYRHNLSDASLSDIFENPVAIAIQALLKQSLSPSEAVISCTSNELLRKMNALDCIPEVTKRTTSWPKNPKALGRVIDRLTPQLKLLGVVINKRKSNGVRLIDLSQKKFPEKNDPNDPDSDNSMIISEKARAVSKDNQAIDASLRAVNENSRAIKRTVSATRNDPAKNNINQEVKSKRVVRAIISGKLLSKTDDSSKDDGYHVDSHGFYVRSIPGTNREEIIL